MDKNLVVDEDTCISCGLCAEIAPNTFKLDENDISQVIDPQGDPEDKIEEAIENCPVEAIYWEEE